MAAPTARRDAAEAEWKAAIIRAVPAGEPVARAARVTRPTVYAILRDTD